MSARVRLCVDDVVVYDGDLNEWQATPPDYFKDRIRPDANPEPWMKAIMIIMADAAMSGKSVSIEAATGEDHWSIKVATMTDLSYLPGNS